MEIKEAASLFLLICAGKFYNVSIYSSNTLKKASFFVLLQRVNL